MIDFPIMPETAPKFAWILSGALYFLVLAIYYKWAFERPNSQFLYTKKSSLAILVFIYCIIAIYCGDWVHMQIIVKGSVGVEYNEGYGVERVYHYLANLLNGNYFLFRTIVWGAGLVFLMQAFKRCRIDAYRALYFLFCIYITLFAYSRAGVAHAIFFCGYVMLFQSKENNSLKNIIVALSIIIASVFAHRSMLVLVVLVPLSIIPINRKSLPFVFMGILILLFAWRGLFQTAMSYLLSSDEYAYRIELYEEIAGSQSFSGFSWLFYLWYKAAIHVLFWFSIVHLFKRINQGVVSLPVQAIFRFSILLYVFTIMMLIMYGNKSALYYRYESMLFIPVTILMSYLFQNGFIKINTYKILFWIFALSQCKDFIYRILFV